MPRQNQQIRFESDSVQFNSTPFISTTTKTTRSWKSRFSNMPAGSSYSSSSMSFISLIVFLTILNCCRASLSSSDSNSIGIGTTSFVVFEQREFDYFKLALQWPPTYCRRTKHCCSSNACCRGANAPPGFTIHGLWPDYNDGTWPACCTHAAFDEKEISTLRDALDTYWPSLSCGTISNCFGKKGSFWAHEWGKHGTCSAPVVHDEYNYFLTALNVYFKYNVTEVLNEAGYVPSNSEMYPVGGIISAIQNAFHATPTLACSNGALQELYLCFYKDFKPRDCAISSKDSSKSSCPKYISLPTYTSLGLKDIPIGVDSPQSTVEAM